MQKYIPLVARVLLSLIFIQSGFNKMMNLGGTQQYMVTNGIPQQLAGLLLVCALLIELIGGFSVLLGYKARLGALVLFLFLIPTTLIFHGNFAQSTQMTQFMKNLAIMGGLLMVYNYGSGSFSLDTRFPSRRLF